MIPGSKRGNSCLQCSLQKLKFHRKKITSIFFLFYVISDSLLGSSEVIKEVKKRRSPKEILKQYNFTFFPKSFPSGGNTELHFSSSNVPYQASCWKTNIWALFYTNSTISLFWRNRFYFLSSENLKYEKCNN